MSAWQLVDGRAPLEEDEEHPHTEIRSEEQLHHELRRLSRLRPARVGLIAPAGDHLDLAIGGPFAGVTWWPPKPALGHTGSRVALAALPTSPETIEFIAEGVPDPVTPQELLPVDEVIEAALFFYREHQLPEWLSWRQWNPTTKLWDTTPSSKPAPADVLAK